jgi:hypothetical protein
MLVGEALYEGKLMYATLFDSTSPLSSIFFALLDWLMDRSTVGRQIVALLLIFFQASFFAIILIRNKAYNDGTFIPALVFGILCFFSFDLFTINSELLASSLLLIALNNLFKEIEFKIQRDEIILNLGFYLGLASLFLFSYAIFLIATVLILLVFTRINLRKYLLLIVGFLLPHSLLFCFYLYKEQAAFLYQNFYLPNFIWGGIDYVPVKSMFLLLGLPLALFLVALIKINSDARFTKYQSQLSQVMFIWLLFSLVQVSMTREFTPHSFIIFIPSLTYFISHYFLLFKRKLLAEYIFAGFLLGIVCLNWFSKYGYIKGVEYERCFVNIDQVDGLSNKKIMLLKDEISIYSRNKLAGYFLDWNLSLPVLNNPDYFENVLLINQMLTVDPPDIIIDPENKIKAFLKFMPEVEKRYKKDGQNYFRISN